jgi:hypothetical protein
MKGKTTLRGYGWDHQKMRQIVQREVAAGLAVCPRCGLRIDSGEPWDLGHADDDRSVWTGPEHRRCNRATNRRRWHSRKW